MSAGPLARRPGSDLATPLRALWEHSETHPRPWLWGTLALALALRAALFLLKGVSGEDPSLLDVARNLASGRGLHVCNQYFPFCGPGNDATAQVGPIPAAVFAAMLRLFGEPAGVTAIVVLQIALGLLTTLCVYALTRRLLGSKRTALLAALLCASYPLLAQLELYPREEPLFTVSLVGATLVLVIAVSRGAPFWFGLAGAGFGVASLCRFSLLYFPLLLAPCLPLLIGGSARRRVTCALAFAFSFTVAMAPWVWRNQREFGAFVPGGTLMGYNLYRHNQILASNDHLHYVRGEEGEVAVRALLARHTDLRGDENEAQMDRVYREAAVEIIRDHPVRYVELSAYRLLQLFTDYGVNLNRPSWSWWIPGIGNLLIVLLALAAALRRRLRKPAVLVLLLLLGYYIGGHALANTRLRYLVPVMPLFMVLAADTLAVLGSAAVDRRDQVSSTRATAHSDHSSA